MGYFKRHTTFAARRSIGAQLGAGDAQFGAKSAQLGATDLCNAALTLALTTTQLVRWGLGDEARAWTTMRLEEASRKLRGSFEEARGSFEERCASRNTDVGARARLPSYSPGDLRMTPDERSSVSNTFAILFAAMVADAAARKEPIAEDGRGGISPSPEAGRGGGEVEPRPLRSAEALRDTSISIRDTSISSSRAIK